jgi:hypothetical protein
MATTVQTTSHASTIGAMAAGKLLAKATGGRWAPAILILAGVVLLRKGAAARAAKRERTATAGEIAGGQSGEAVTVAPAPRRHFF